MGSMIGWLKQGKPQRRKRTRDSDLVQNPAQMPWRRFAMFGIVIGVLFFVFSIVYYALLAPILVSCLFAYLFMPLVNYMAAHWRLGRSYSSLLLMLIMVAILALASSRIYPLVYEQFLGLFYLVPQASESFEKSWLPYFKEVVGGFRFLNWEKIELAWQQFNFVQEVSSRLQAGVSNLWYASFQVIGGIVNMVIVPVLTFFILKDYHRIRANLWRLVPDDLVTTTRLFFMKMDQTLKAVIKGQVIVAAFVGALYIIGFSAIGLQAALAIGFAAGICRIVPYADVIVGALLSAVVILSDFHSWHQFLAVALVIISIQVIDALFITPRVIGDRVGLHPAVVIVSVLAFGFWFGFWGILLAIPIAALVKGVGEIVLPLYLDSEWFHGTYLRHKNAIVTSIKKNQLKQKYRSSRHG